MTDHFEWNEIDFGQGLWSTSGNFLMPQGAAQELTDCYVQQSGGLRAFARLVTRSRTGIPSDHFPVAIFARGGIDNRVGTGKSTDYYILTYKDSTSEGFLYRWDETADPDPTSWTLLKTFAASTGVPVLANFIPYLNSSDGTFHVYMNYTASGSADQGLWRIRYSDGNVSQVTTHSGIRAFTSHQDRLIYGTTESQGTRLRYSDPGTHTFAAASFIDVFPNTNLAGHVWAKSFMGELMLGKEGAPITLAQGDITDPSVQLLSDAHYSATIQGVTEVDDGLAFAARDDGIYVTRSGVEVTGISQMLDTDELGAQTGSNSGGSGNLVYAAPFLYTPSGHVWDSRTKVWFRTSHWGLGALPLGKAMTHDRATFESELLVCTDEEDFDIVEVNTEEGTLLRNRTFTYLSPPLRHPSGRLLVVREVQVVLDPQASGASCVVTVNGQTRTITGVSSSRQAIRFPFNEVNEVLDIKVVPDSGSASVEAPQIEAVRVGTLAGHLIPADSVA